jgi:hypothetical protein
MTLAMAMWGTKVATSQHITLTQLRTMAFCLLMAMSPALYAHHLAPDFSLVAISNGLASPITPVPINARGQHMLASHHRNQFFQIVFDLSDTPQDSLAKHTTE